MSEINEHNILIVDNIESNLNKLELLIKSSFDNINLTKKLNAKDAIDSILNGNNYDLILFDIHMPEIDGFEFIRQLKKHKNIPVVFLSDSMEKDKYEYKSYLLGVIDFINKATDENLLVLRLKNVIKTLETERHLKDERFFIQSLLNVSSEGQIIFDKESNTVDFNNRATDIFQDINKNITINKLFEDEAKKEGSLVSLINYLNNYFFYEDEKPIFKKNHFYYKMELKDLMDYSILSFFDVTDEYKKAIKNQAIFDAQDSLIFVTNGATITNVNIAFFKNFDYDNLNEFLLEYECISELFIDKPDDIPHLKPIMDDGIRWTKYIYDNPSIKHEAYMIDKNGKERIYEVKNSGNCLEEEGETEEVIVFNEITEAKEQLNLIQEQSRFAAMGEMIAMIAHQWKQPLTSVGLILSKIDVMFNMGLYSANNYKKDYGILSEQVEYMSNTIDDFKTFFQGDELLNEIMIEKIIDSSISLVSGLISKNKISLDIVYDIDKSTNILVSQSKLNQVLLNIYKNAMDELTERNITGAILKIEIDEDSKYVNIKISDNAGGVPKEILKKIFDPYFSTKAKNGTGIGLYMSKLIIENKFNGQLLVKNTKIGAMFIIKLPK
jgi:nitrogen-specific signal transduction histidine kinase/CheY-like chemotaxis protein